MAGPVNLLPEGYSPSRWLRNTLVACGSLAVIAGSAVAGSYALKDQSSVAKQGALWLGMYPDLSSVKDDLSSGKFLVGGFFNDSVDLAHLQKWADKIGGQPDFAVRYLTFSELKGRLGFPENEVKGAASVGTKVLIKLQSWSALGAKDSSYSLDKVVSGESDDLIEASADGAAAFGGPVMVAFDPHMNTTDFPWAGNPTAYKAAFKRVVEISNKRGANNITWVWNPLLTDKNPTEYYPGSMVDVIALDVFQKATDSTDAVLETLAQRVAELKLLGKPIILSTVGSSAPEAQRRDFMARVTAKAKTLGLSGIGYFDAKQIKQGSVTWGIDAGAFSDLRAQLVIQPVAMTPAEVAAKSSDIKVTTQVTNAAMESTLEGIRKNLERLQSITDPISRAQARIQISKDYCGVASMESDKATRRTWYEKALSVIDEPFQREAEREARGEKPDRFPIIFGFIDLKLQKSAVLAEMGEMQDSLTVVQQVISDLNDRQTLVEEQIKDYSVPGYLNRAKLMIAMNYERDKERTGALALYREVSDWAEKEQGVWVIKLAWQGEDRVKLRYLGTMAWLGEARVHLGYGEYDQAIEIYQKVFNWKDIGRESGYMDLGLQGILDVMATLTNANPENAVERFSEVLPWAQIEGYKDFKKALNLEAVDLASLTPEERWDKVLRALGVSLTDNKQKETLGQIRDRWGLVSGE